MRCRRHLRGRGGLSRLSRVIARGGSGASCGNGICEAGDGEDCVRCPADCAGKQGGKPSGRYCCGDGDGEGAVGCGDSRCGASCTETPSTPWCCGDGVCGDDEPTSACELDCGAPPPPPPPPLPACDGDGVCEVGRGLHDLRVRLRRRLGRPAGQPPLLRRRHGPRAPRATARSATGTTSARARSSS